MFFNRFDKAEHYFMETLSRLKEINEPLLADKWEALFNNLGHVSRKLKKYDKALEYHQQVRNSFVISSTIIALIQIFSRPYYSRH